MQWGKATPCHLAINRCKSCVQAASCSSSTCTQYSTAGFFCLQALHRCHREAYLHRRPTLRLPARLPCALVPHSPKNCKLPVCPSACRLLIALTTKRDARCHDHLLRACKCTAQRPQQRLHSAWMRGCQPQPCTPVHQCVPTRTAWLTNISIKCLFSLCGLIYLRSAGPPLCLNAQVRVYI